MKAVIFFIGVFFSCIHLSAQSEKQTDASFDWIKINPTESFDRFAWETLPQGITQVMVESLLASPYLTTDDPTTLFQVQGQLLAVIPCRFEVLRWTGDSWENLYKGSTVMRIFLCGMENCIPWGGMDFGEDTANYSSLILTLVFGNLLRSLPLP
jgi:hypothetical protein